LEKNRVEICDITLREGEQTPGVFFKLDDKITIAEELLKSGIRNIEIGVVGISLDERAYEEIYRNTSKRNRNLSMALLPYETSFKRYLNSNIQYINIVVPLTEFLSGAFGSDPKSIHKLVGGWVDNLIKQKRNFRIVLADASRAIFSQDNKRKQVIKTLEHNLKVITNAIETFVDKGAKEFIIADTLGIFTPTDVHILFGFLNSKYKDIRWGVHFHNDFGLATANVLAAYSNGATLLQSAFNSLGERSGIASTAEICAALKYLYDVKLGVDIRKLRSIANKLEAITEIIINHRAPVVGRGLYWYETATPLFGMMKYKPSFFEIITAEDVKAQRKIIIGKHTSNRLFDYLKKEGILNNGTEHNELRTKAIERREAYKTDLSSMIELYHKMSEESLTSIPFSVQKNNKKKIL